uniref:Ribosomal protein 3 n=1 Tax=Knoxdaviesia proteae TaxID=1215355 RepID=D2E400_9PEZI|nr:ribosomal protein 3 [Knoxdaviesia proteae]
MKKIFNNNLNKKFKSTQLNINTNDKGKLKYFPAFSNEWLNSTYFYNKNNIKNVPFNFIEIQKIIKHYFAFFFKGDEYFNFFNNSPNNLLKIHISKANIKYTYNKAIITIYIINLEKNILLLNYKKVFNYYMPYLLNIFDDLNILRFNHIKLISQIWNKFQYIYNKEIYLKTLIIINKTYIDKLNILLKNFISFSKIIKINLNIYLLNEIKLKNIYLNKLSKLISKILNKKYVEFKIINLKSFINNPDIFTSILGIKLSKDNLHLVKNVNAILNRIKFNNKIFLKERRLRKSLDLDLIENKFQNLRILSNLKNKNINELFNNLYEIKLDNKSNLPNDNYYSIYNNIFNNIKYKKLGGIRIEVKGRLSRRYRADRAIFKFNWKGGLENIDSSVKGISTVLTRGHLKSNIVHSMYVSKRHIGAFAVKGWISGK